MPSAKQIAPQVGYLPAAISNVYLVGEPGGRAPWALVDTAIVGKFGWIKEACEARFGTSAPEAIVLTHGHFDHSGSALALATYWDVPVYVHPLDLPYVTGKMAFPPRTRPSAARWLSRAAFFRRTWWIWASGRARCPPTARCPECPAGAGCTRPVTLPATSRFGGKRIAA
jgi:glyoxylase-like metal-dependent hydrolase (beta-lactamase superfamily II)